MTVNEMAAVNAVNRDESIDIVSVLALVWRGKWWVLGVTLLCVALAAYYAFTATNWYRAEVLLKLAETKSTQGLSNSLGALGGLASLAGISVGTNSPSEPIAVLTSREFIGAFIKDQDLLPLLFAKNWDASTKQWKKPGSVDQPDVRDGVRYFNKSVLKVLEDRKTNLITLTIDWTDAATAAAWANLLVERVNEELRKRALAEAQSNVGYLKQELSTASLVTMQQSIGRVLEDELQKLMLANVSKEYAFKILDHAQVPKWRSRPQRLLLVSGAFVAGFLLSVIFLIVRDAVRRARYNPNRA